MKRVAKLKQQLSVVRRQKTCLVKRVRALTALVNPQAKALTRAAQRWVHFPCAWNQAQLRRAVKRFEARQGTL